MLVIDQSAGLEVNLVLGLDVARNRRDQLRHVSVHRPAFERRGRGLAHLERVGQHRAAQQRLRRLGMLNARQHFDQQQVQRASVLVAAVDRQARLERRNGLRIVDLQNRLLGRLPFRLATRLQTLAPLGDFRLPTAIGLQAVGRLPFRHVDLLLREQLAFVKLQAQRLDRLRVGQVELQRLGPVQTLFINQFLLAAPAGQLLVRGGRIYQRVAPLAIGRQTSIAARQPRYFVQLDPRAVPLHVAQRPTRRCVVGIELQRLLEQRHHGLVGTRCIGFERRLHQLGWRARRAAPGGTRQSAQHHQRSAKRTTTA